MGTKERMGTLQWHLTQWLCLGHVGPEVYRSVCPAAPLHGEDISQSLLASSHSIGFSQGGFADLKVEVMLWKMPKRRQS